MVQRSRLDRAEMAVIEREKPPNAETLRGDDNGRVGKSDLQIAVLPEDLGAAHDIPVGQRHKLELPSSIALRKSRADSAPRRLCRR